MSHKPVRGRRLLLPAAVPQPGSRIRNASGCHRQSGWRTERSRRRRHQRPRLLPLPRYRRQPRLKAPLQSPQFLPPRHLPLHRAPRPPTTRRNLEFAGCTSKAAAPSPSAFPTPSATFTERIVEMQNAPAPREAIAPLADVLITKGVPEGDPTKYQAKLIVKKGGDRQGNSVSGLANASVYVLSDDER